MVLEETTLFINLTALRNNFKFLKQQLEPGTKFIAIVKAFAYGSDSISIAKELEKLGADYLAVAYTQEGVTLRKAGITLPIIVLHAQSCNYDVLIKHNLEPNLYSVHVLDVFLEKIKALQKENYPIHIKFNSGLNRLGFIKNDVTDIISKIKGNASVKLVSIFSHLAATEDENERKFTLEQIAKFNAIAERLNKELEEQPWKHILNTSGILNYPEAQYQMVRSGIGLYGFGNHNRYKKQLQPVASLKTIISQIHHIDKGESIGYNRALIANTKMRIATLPLGHADGIGRQYGNTKGQVYINNTPVPIVGNICMDMIMIDISTIDCKEGDEVVIFDEHYNATTFAKGGDSISYEILTAISPRIKRVIID